MSANGFRDDMSLAEVRDQLREMVVAGDSVRCPCCTQNAKIYNRKLNKTMVSALAMLAAHADFVHVPTLMQNKAKEARELGKLANFELVDEERTRRPDGGRSGYWRITPLGREFLAGRARVPTYAHVYDGRLLRHSGELVTVAEVAPEFRFDELMEGI